VCGKIRQVRQGAGARLVHRVGRDQVPGGQVGEGPEVGSTVLVCGEVAEDIAHAGLGPRARGDAELLASHAPKAPAPFGGRGGARTPCPWVSTRAGSTPACELAGRPQPRRPFRGGLRMVRRPSQRHHARRANRRSRLSRQRRIGSEPAGGSRVQGVRIRVGMSSSCLGLMHAACHRDVRGFREKVPRSSVTA
jgi:hypothetical protein